MIWGGCLPLIDRGPQSPAARTLRGRTLEDGNRDRRGVEHSDAVPIPARDHPARADVALLAHLASRRDRAVKGACALGIEPVELDRLGAAIDDRQSGGLRCRVGREVGFVFAALRGAQLCTKSHAGHADGSPNRAGERVSRWSIPKMLRGAPIISVCACEVNHREPEYEARGQWDPRSGPRRDRRQWPGVHLRSPARFAATRRRPRPLPRTTIHRNPGGRRARADAAR